MLAALVLATGLAACGGGESSSSTVAEAGSQGQVEGKAGGSSNQGEAANAGAEGKSGSSGDQKQSFGSGGNASDFVPKHHTDSGGGSQQFRVKGGDNSIQEFGGEAESSEFDAAAAVLHDFLDARAEGNSAAACKYLSKRVVESFEKLAAQQAEKASCGGILEALTNPSAKQLMKAEAAKADVHSLRSEGERGFLIYSGLKGTAIAIPMENESGTWKVASIAGTPIS